MFQFYLSSIKRLKLSDTERELASFNSTLVQLKELKNYHTNYKKKGFNSTLVQLKARTMKKSLLCL